MENWFTFQVTLHRKEEGTDMCQVHEFRDCDDARIKELRNDVWTKGLRINMSVTSWEIISPFMVKSVMIIKQDKKFNPI